MRKRDEYLDMLRGIATLNIVLLHAVFYGKNIMPLWFRNLIMLIDVPAFFFISGWGGYYLKNFKQVVRNCMRTWLQWIIFLFATLIACQLIYNWHYESTIHFTLNLFFVFTEIISPFPVIYGSVWFLPVYFVITFLGFGITKCVTDKKALKLLLASVLVLFLYVSMTGEKMQLQRHLFYLAFYILGFVSVNFRFRNMASALQALVLIIFLLPISGFITGLEITDFQKCKFPPTLPYFFVSCIFAVIALYYKGRITHFPKLITHIGRHAIFYYFAQMITSATIPIQILDPILQRFPVMIQEIAYIIAAEIFTVFLAEALRLLYNGIYNTLAFGIRKIRDYRILLKREDVHETN